MPSHFLARSCHYTGSTGCAARVRARTLDDRSPITLVTLTLLALGLATALVGCSLAGNGATGAKSRTGPKTPTPVAQGELAKAVMLNLWSLGVKQVQTVYQPRDASVTVTITLGGTIPSTPLKISAANDLTKSDCLMALQALWTSGIPLSRTMVLVQGPTQDEYANTINQPYGEVTLTTSQAHQIDWNSITAAAAWDAYGNDNEYLRGNFGVYD